MEQIAAVVVTYNRKELLLQCLDRLLNQKGTTCDVLIVDNASTDGTEQAIGQLRNPQVYYRNTGANLGGAGGFNFGMRWAVEAGYDYLWIMDDDTLPSPDALAQLWAAHERLGGNYGFLSSTVLWTDGELCPMNVQRITPYRDLLRFDQGEEIPVQMASFVSLFLQAQTVEQYGLPIKDFFVWTDDWEYTRRISRISMCYVVPKSKVIHAMKNKTVVNIARDTPDRVERYRYFYRNDVYLYRREGIKGWLWIVLKNSWHSVQVLRAGKQPIEKLRIIWGSFFRGIGFQPEKEYCKRPSKIRV